MASVIIITSRQCLAAASTFDNAKDDIILACSFGAQLATIYWIS
uniref:Uncharacterized protein n=1 Tax=Rhizophora mucronata TaxID=61149 RepID=A0A2P2PR58_RHIMU